MGVVEAARGLELSAALGTHPALAVAGCGLQPIFGDYIALEALAGLLRLP